MNFLQSSSTSKKMQKLHEQIVTEVKWKLTLKSKLVLEVSWLAPILQEVGSGRELGHNSAVSSAGALVAEVQPAKFAAVKLVSCVLSNGG